MNRKAPVTEDTLGPDAKTSARVADDAFAKIEEQFLGVFAPIDVSHTKLDAAAETSD